MKGYFIYILISITVIFGACKKTEYPKETRVDGNYFYSNLNVNGSPLTLKAGTDGYYMFSSYNTSVVDSFNVSKYSGEFKQSECEICNNSIKIQINDPKLVGQNPGDVNQIINANTYSFFSGADKLRYEVKFKGTYNKTTSQISWDFGDGSGSSQLNPTHFYNAGTYKVLLRIKSTGLCESVIEQTLSLGPNSLNAVISNTANLRTLTFTPAIYGGTPPYTYFWNFGDGSPELVTTTLATSHTYALKGTYPVKLKVKDSEGYICYSNLNAITKDDPSACTTNFTYPKPTETLLSYGTTNVSVQFTDANGVTYSSDGAMQPETSSLQILSAEEFQKNEKGEPVKRVKLKFNCLVFNGTRSINLKGTEVYIGFAYK